jgi:Domain of unknown function (DUF5011)/Domain of unknown function (DUF5012)
MKTLYKKITALALLGSLFTLTSCYEDPISSTVTVYPVIELQGDEQVILNLGAAWEDPGAMAFIGEDPVEVSINYKGLFTGSSSSTLNTSVADFYTATYSAMNQDGFSGSVTREIIVANTGDLVSSLEGLYRSTVVRNGATAAQYTDMEYVLIWKNSDGTYELSDAFGGYYDIGRAYGPTYITPGGVIVANDIATNDFSFPGTQSNASFGGASEITAMTVDASAGTIDYTNVWQADASTTYTFVVHLEQVQF